MADWTNISDTQIDPDAPLTSSLAYAWRDNPIAISEGATGAPRILDAALSTTVTAAGQNWVFNRIIARGHGGVGQTVMARWAPPAPTHTGVSFGESVAASSLFPSNAGGAVGSGMSGTWRCMGYIASNAPAGPETTTCWQRIS